MQAFIICMYVFWTCRSRELSKWWQMRNICVCFSTLQVWVGEGTSWGWVASLMSIVVVVVVVVSCAFVYCQMIINSFLLLLLTAKLFVLWVKQLCPLSQWVPVSPPSPVPQAVKSTWKNQHNHHLKLWKVITKMLFIYNFVARCALSVLKRELRRRLPQVSSRKTLIL